MGEGGVPKSTPHIDCGSQPEILSVATLQGTVVPLLRMSTGLTKHLIAAPLEAVVIDPFSTLAAGDALSFVAGEFFRGDVDFYPFLREEILVGHLAIRVHLLLVLILDLGIHLSRLGLGRFAGGDADGSAALEIDEGCCHLAPVAELEGALAEAASGDDSNSIGRAAVDFYIGNEALAIFAARLVDAQALAAQHCHAHAEDLSGAEMAMRYLGQRQECIEGVHISMVCLSSSVFAI